MAGTIIKLYYGVTHFFTSSKLAANPTGRGINLVGTVQVSHYGLTKETKNTY